MTDLSRKRCAPCTGDTPRVAPDEVTRLLLGLPGYKADLLVGSISKTYEFKDFYETMAFVNAVAWIANQQDHHPDLTVGYGKAGVLFATHSVGGLSENDFICAAKVNALGSL